MNWSNSKVRFRDTSRLVFQELQERHLVGRNSMVGLLNIATFIEEKRISVGLWPFYPKVSNWMELVFWKLMSDIWVLPLHHWVEGFLSYNLTVFFLKFWWGLLRVHMTSGFFCCKLVLLVVGNGWKNIFNEFYMTRVHIWIGAQTFLSNLGWSFYYV